MQRLLVASCVLLVVLSGQARAGTSWLDRIFGSPVEAAAGATPDASPALSGLDSPIAPSPYVPPAISDYKLGPGDNLSITVFNEKDLSIEARLSDAGTFFYPLLGEVRAQGMTIGQIQDFLTARLRDGYLVNPKIYVAILEYRPFFVNGEVSKPGGFPFQPGLTVRKAISLAGGFTARASYSKLYVIRDDDPLGVPRPITLNSFLQPGDIVTVEQSFF